MKLKEKPETKILSGEDLIKKTSQWKSANKKIAFTNGCFNILHPGHIYSLQQASAEADYLIVGINADDSVKKLKGAGWPINNQAAGSLIIASLAMVDAVCTLMKKHRLN